MTARSAARSALRRVAAPYGVANMRLRRPIYVENGPLRGPSGPLRGLVSRRDHDVTRATHVSMGYSHKCTFLKRGVMMMMMAAAVLWVSDSSPTPFPVDHTNTPEHRCSL